MPNTHTHTHTCMQATCTNLQKAAGNVHEINLQRRVPPKGVCERGWGTHKARVLLIQHDIARKMQKLNEGQLSVQLLFLLCRLLQQKSESGLNVFVRIRQRFHTCSSSTAAARRSGRGCGRGSTLLWWPWSSGIKCQLEFQVRSPLGRVQALPTPWAQYAPSPLFVSLLASPPPSLHHPLHFGWTFRKRKLFIASRALY